MHVRADKSLVHASKALSTLATTVAGNGDKSPNSATVAEFRDYSRQCGQGLSRRPQNVAVDFDASVDDLPEDR